MFKIDQTTFKSYCTISGHAVNPQGNPSSSVSAVFRAGGPAMQAS